MADYQDFKMDGKTLDITKENIAAMKQLFPEIVTDGKVDFEKLRLILGDEVETSDERYNFTWHGKNRAIRLSQTPSLGTLRPCKEDSVNWDTTKNLYIEGDNLEVLKLLQRSYFGKIKMIYIDPPYNTGGDFVYDDDFVETQQEFGFSNGYLDALGRKLRTNSNSDGRFHTKWLNMIYPRLKLARNLLTDDGVILINMDENEIVNLHQICNEIFGEGNDLGTIIWDKRNPKGEVNGIACQNEYILVYAKDKNYFSEKREILRPKKNAAAMLKKASQLFKKINNGYSLEDVNSEFQSWLKTLDGLSGGEKAYCQIDENGDVYRLVPMTWPNKKKAPDEYFIPLIHPITGKPCPVPARGWRNPPSKMNELLSKGLIIFGKDETTIPNRKYLLKDNMFENIPSLLYNGGSDTKLLEQMNIPFDTPKMVSICKEHIAAFTDDGDIIMDFFSGSCTVAHAVMELNFETNSHRRFIMVQIPEVCPEDSPAKKQGFNTICDLGIARIRAAAKIIKPNSNQTTIDGSSSIDLGFRVFKQDISNVVAWNSNSDIKQSLISFENNLLPDRTDMDLVFEVMLKLGLDISNEIKIVNSNDSSIYVAGDGALMMYFGNISDLNVAEIMKSLYLDMNPLVWKVVFRDNGFASDDVKANTRETLKMAGLQDGSFITL